MWLIIDYCLVSSFVGGDQAGRHIYQRGSGNGKRVQCNMGAKNHGVIMPDANKESVLIIVSQYDEFKFFLSTKNTPQGHNY